MIDSGDWRALLTEWNTDLLSDEEIRDDLPPEVLQSGWLGFPPATETQILQAEQRLGATLPPSYRAFLRVTNGWRRTGYFIYRIRPVEKIAWFRIERPELVQDYVDAEKALEPVPDTEYFVYGEGQNPLAYRGQYLRSALQITDEGDSAVYLLNSEIQTGEGEWEAWFFAAWRPGADRYRSFWDMVQAEYHAYQELRAQANPP